MTLEETIIAFESRIAIRGKDPGGEPYEYQDGTRQILEQKDLFPPGTPCRIVSVEELETVVRAYRGRL